MDVSSGYRVLHASRLGGHFAPQETDDYSASPIMRSLHRGARDDGGQYCGAPAAYDRKAHWTQWLQRMRGRDVPPSVVDAVLQECVRKAVPITYGSVRDILRRLSRSAGSHSTDNVSDSSTTSDRNSPSGKQTGAVGDDDTGVDGRHSEARSPATLVDLCIKALCLRWMAVPPRANAAYRALPEELRERANAAYRALPEELRERVAPWMRHLAMLVGNARVPRWTYEPQPTRYDRFREARDELAPATHVKDLPYALHTGRLPPPRPHPTTARVGAAQSRPRESRRVPTGKRNPPSGVC